MAIDGFTEYAKEDREKYNKKRWWLGMTWGDLFDKATDIYPDKVGLVDGVGRWTYSELREKVDRLAVSFMKLGIKPKEWVLLQFPNWHEYILAFFAMQKIGALTLLLIPRHNQSEINHLCALTKPVAWVVPQRYGKIDYQPVIDDVLKENPQLEHVIQIRTDGHNSPYLNFDRLIETAELTPENLKALEDRRPDPDEVSHIMPTGGTTGLPKASVRTHNCYIANVEYHSRAWEITSNDTLMVVTPVGHSMAMHWGIGAAFLNFAKLALLDSTQPEDICEWIQKEKVTAIPTVPALVTRVLGMKDRDKYDLSSLKKISVGGAPSTPDLVREVYDKLGCIFINAFGSSEGTNTSTRPGDSIDVICNSVGRPACPYDRIIVIDEAGNEMPPGVEGELVSKGPGVFTGYFKSQEENSQTFTPDGFFKTGDKARKDKFGNITITGRIKDIINRGGEKISAIEIENRLSAHPGIHEAAVVGMPDKVLGERICAYVTLRPGVTLTFEEAVAFLKAGGASLQQLPERIEFVAELPVTKIGKVDKKALREDIRKRLET
ncbi:MAG: 2,3-dihydroxybenzoate-AMP ligase [Syntrophorhabdaceae bacterium PtaU1.Bin034]|nr:MAG: 2,3-dihydroxybenzoate-AMP ligase [Syntrophorhabdaceae bacterium PtaU1.Bin034]